MVTEGEVVEVTQVVDGWLQLTNGWGHNRPYWVPDRRRGASLLKITHRRYSFET